MKPLLPLVAALLLLSPPAVAQDDQGAPQPAIRPRSGRFTYGGSVGLGIGSASWGVSLRGEVGYLATDRLWTGVSGRFQWTHDDYGPETYDSVDYGVGAYARYFVVDRLFATTEWDWTSYEVRSTGPSAGRESFSSFFVGGGYGQPLGPRSLFLVEVLYDVTGNARGLYDTPWVTRLSFATGF
ncbi:MAG: hypothetical protein IPN03_23710 [Holophagales bacterium]|nr:hypothetical protein [Holophagales bacterium]MBK9376640.1 hypothetical protein [Holophagales bacterium]